MRRNLPSQLTLDVLDLLKQYGDKGAHLNVLVSHFGVAVERYRIRKTLDNLRARGLARSKYQRTHDGGHWFFCTDGKAFVNTSTEAKRIERARQLDKYQPMSFYGQDMVAPRAASVWAYAHYFQEHRA